MLEEAKKFARMGLSVVASRSDDKRPIGNWTEYQTKKASDKELADWFKDKKNNIGFITGKISNIVVIDIDKGTDIDKLAEYYPLPETATVNTGGGGRHYYYLYPEGREIKTKARIFGDTSKWLVDIRADGGFIVAPPSVHPTTKKKYEWIVPFEKITALPNKWLEKIEAKEISFDQVGATVRGDWKDKLMSPIENGSRNASFTAIIGGLLQRFPQHDWDSVVWTLVQSENHVQKQPLSEHELRTSFNSIAKAELTKRNSGGEIKDISVINTEEQIDIEIRLEKATVCCRAKNIAAEEGNAFIWLKRASGLSHSIDYHFKLHSDSSKESWARLLKNTFDRKDDKEIYPWSLLVSKICLEIDKVVQNRKQAFRLDTITPKDVTWLLEPFIQEDQINTFFGLGSSGKTMLSMYFGSMVAEENKNVMLIDYENDSSSWASKMLQLTEHKERFVYFESEQTPIFDQVDKIRQAVREHNIKLVIVDSASLASGDSTSDEKAALKLFAGLKLLKTTVILIAHQRKNEGDKNPIGSIQYENQARNVWNFSAKPDSYEDGVLHVACKHTKANNTFLRREPICFRVSFSGGTIEIAKEDASNFEEKLSVPKRIEKLLQEEGKMLPKDITTILGVKIGTVKAALSKGKIFINDKDGFWSLKPLI